ncbi:MAG: S-layer homology domain-containing protein [Clostridia bacterium]|nr:S-layer homology domain-containing protein [Clostridia bacterium]
MKLNGKKALALILSISMMLSLCCVNVSAATVKPTAIEITGEKTVIGVGEVLELEITATPDNASKSVTWSTSSKTYATVSTNGKVTGKKAGTATITAKSKSDTSKTDTYEITVKDVTSITMDDITVGLGTSASTVEAILNAQEIIKNYEGGSFESTCDSTWDWECDNYDRNEPGTYTFVLDSTKISGEVDVTVGDITLQDSADATLDAIYVPVGTKVTTVTSSLPTSVSLLLNNKATEQSLSVGTKTTNYFKKWVCDELGSITKFETAGTYTFVAESNEKEKYNLPDLILPVIIYNDTVAEIELDADTSYVYLEEAVDEITAALTNIFGSEAELKGVKITKITGKKEGVTKASTSYISGTLYADDECETEVEVSTDAYSATAFAEMCFVANGKGHDTIVSYTAFADADGEKSVKGDIVITSEQFMLLNMEVGNSEILDFVSSDFSAAFKKLDSKNTLVSIEFDNNLSASEGELYYKYDTKKEEVVGSSDELFVKADADDDEWDLDDVTFVPDEDATGLVTIEFTAYGYYDGDKDDIIDAEGVLQITIHDKADIEIFAGVEEKVPVDVEPFEEFLDDEVDTDDIAYIVFDGAPYTTTDGYLVAGTKSFKTSGDKTFHMDPDSDEYDLEDLYFVGGSSKGTKRASFEIYYYDGKNVEDEPVTGTVEFITGVSTNIYTKEPLAAAQVLDFSSSITAFEKVGEQDNAYFKFTTLPKGAKLYYNYGLSSQEDVTTGTAYYLTSGSGRKLLKNITFVPSYSSAKTQQVITFEYKAYDKDDNYVSGACFFEVKYASKSANFSDITSKTYADSVDFLYNRGITTGVPGGKYDANGSLTRAQVVTFLYRAAGSPAVSGTTTFKDIVKGEYYYNAVLWASQTGVTNGRSATVFDPNATVTNAEVIQFMYNFDVKYLKHTAYTNGSTSVVTDYAKVESWAQTAVKWAIGKEVLTSGYLYPATVGTRGNIALYLHRMLTL